MADQQAGQQADFESFVRAFAWDEGDGVLYGLRRLMAVMDLIVLPLKDSKAEYDQAVINFVSILNERFATDIQPLFDAIMASASLGSIFMTSSVTPVRVSLGRKLFDVKPGDRLKYAAPGYIAAISAGSPRVAMLGTLVGFDRDEGVLVIDVTSVTSDGATASDWNLVPSPPPFIPVGINAGSYDGSAPIAGVPFISTADTGGGISGGPY